MEPAKALPLTTSNLAKLGGLVHASANAHRTGGLAASRVGSVAGTKMGGGNSLRAASRFGGEGVKRIPTVSCDVVGPLAWGCPVVTG